MAPGDTTVGSRPSSSVSWWVWPDRRQPRRRARSGDHQSASAGGAGRLAGFDRAVTNIGPLPAPVLAVLRDPRNGINFNRVVDGGEWTAKLTTLMEGCGWIARCDLGSQMEVWPATDAPVTWPVLDQIT